MAEKWYLRTQDDVFGPETRERLLDWARMGRIQPGQEVSPDGENWMPATEVEFLGMRWFMGHKYIITMRNRIIFTQKTTINFGLRLLCIPPKFRSHNSANAKLYLKKTQL